MRYLTDTCIVTSSPGLLMKLQTKSWEGNQKYFIFLLGITKQRRKKQNKQNQKSKQTDASPSFTAHVTDFFN